MSLPFSTASELPIPGLVGGGNFQDLDWPAMEAARDRWRAAGRTAKLNLSMVDDLKLQINRRWPPSMRDDAQADWSRQARDENE